MIKQETINYKRNLNKMIYFIIVLENGWTNCR